MITPERTPELVPDGARFLSGSYTNQAGTRPYKVYIPSCYCDQDLPLVVMLHGCTQNPDDFAAGIHSGPDHSAAPIGLQEPQGWPACSSLRSRI